jgi:hypothetical protein
MGGRRGAVERAVVEHAGSAAAAARLRCRGRGGMGVGAVGKPEERESESEVFRIFLATQCESVGPFG